MDIAVLWMFATHRAVLQLLKHIKLMTVAVLSMEQNTLHHLHASLSYLPLVFQISNRKLHLHAVLKQMLPLVIKLSNRELELQYKMVD